MGDTVTFIPGPQDVVRTRIAFSDGTFIENMQVLSRVVKFHVRVLLNLFVLVGQSHSARRVQ